MCCLYLCYLCFLGAVCLWRIFQPHNIWDFRRHHYSYTVDCTAETPGLFYSNFDVIIAFSALTLFVGWWGVGVVICLEWGADCLHMVELIPLSPKVSPCLASFKIQTVFTFPLPFLYQLTQVVLEKRPLNGCSSHSSSSNSSCCCFSSSSTRHSFDVIKIHYLQIFVLKIKLMHITNTLLVTTDIFLDWVCLQQFSVNFIALFCQL